MALPASRNTTYAADSQVKSADLNALQDYVIALCGTRTLQFSPYGAGKWTGSGTAWTDADLGVVQSTTDNPGVYRIPIQGLGVGDRIKSVDIRVHMDAAGHSANTLTATLKLIDRTGIVSTALAADTAGNTNAAGMQTITITPASPAKLVALQDWILELTTGGVTAHQVHSITVHYDHAL